MLIFHACFVRLNNRNGLGTQNSCQQQLGNPQVKVCLSVRILDHLRKVCKNFDPFIRIAERNIGKLFGIKGNLLNHPVLG